MKKFYSLLVCLTSCCAMAQAQTTFPVAIDETNFPDKSFRKVLLTATYDRDQDGMLSQEEAERVIELTMNYKYPHIANLKGIEYFTNLLSLSVQGNDLTAIDLSKNTKLTYLNVKGNKFETIDFSDCPSLEAIICNDNSSLKEVKLAGNPNLRRFECNSVKTLTQLDVSANAELDSLCCYSDGLTAIDVSKNPKLRYLNCSSNKITSLDVTKNPELKTLYCGRNTYEGGVLDLSNNPKLDELDCQQAGLTSLDFTANPALRLLTCSFNNLLTLDLSKNAALYKILVSYNKQMTDLKLGNLPELYDLQLAGCPIESIDLSETPKLNSLNFSFSHMRRIDLSGTPNLKSLTCGTDSLVALDLSGISLTYSGLRYSKSNRTVTLTSGNKFDLSTLAEDGLDVSRVTEVTGGTLDGNILSFTGEMVTYKYLTMCKNANYSTLTVNLIATNYDSDSVSDITADTAAVSVDGRTVNAAGPIAAYSTTGALVASGNDNLTLPAAGLYIIKVGEQTFKVSVR